MISRILREYVTRTLDIHAISNYHQYAHDKADFPYSVFTLSRVTQEPGISQYDLDINVVDNNDYSEVIDDLTDNIVNIFDGENKVIGCYSISSKLNVVNTIDTKNDKLQQRRVLFTLRVVGK